MKILSDNGVRFVGPATVAGVDDTGVHLECGETIEGELIVAATGVRPEAGPAAEAGISTRNGRIVVDERMHTSVLNVYAAGDVALAYNLGARRSIPAEHWRDAAVQGTIAGASAAGFPAAWDDVPGFSCTIGESTLKYRGWGTDYEHSRLVEHRDGFTVWYEAGGEVVGLLSYNADDDYQLANDLVLAHTPITV